MTLRQVLSPAASNALLPVSGEVPGYPFPEGFIDRLKIDLDGKEARGRDLAGVQIGFESPRLSSFLLSHGIQIFAVEANTGRREAGMRLQSSWPAFQVFAGAPDRTGLEDASVDFIVSDRALYWPDQDGVRAEFARILRPGGLVALVTDNRVYGGGEQAQAFEAVLRAHCPEFREKRESHDIGRAVAALFRDGTVFEDAFTGEQWLTLQEFMAQTEAMPVYPAACDPARAPLNRALRGFFGRWAKRGTLTIPTVCRVAFGRMQTGRNGRLV